jgi:UDP-N-acetyl-D-mannosaminuronate dehydrogenase
VSYTDPYVERLEQGGHTLTHVPFDAAVTSNCDCAVIATDHRIFDFSRIASMPLIVDTRNALSQFHVPSIFRL